MSAGARQTFSVDVGGLLAALTEQFPEPLLCLRELIQNAADAGARRIEADIAYDAQRSLIRISVSDDGRGMGERDVEAYLTIGLSEKDPSRARGRFGVGKLSPYALGIQRMVVETCDGTMTHRLTFAGDGSGAIHRLPARPRGTVVRVYKPAPRDEAEALAERAFKLVAESCGSLPIPLLVNGIQVNRDVALPSIYSLSFNHPAGKGVLGIASEPMHVLLGGGIVLENDAPILGAEVSYLLDSPRLMPTLSRNAVRRDQAFDELIRTARAEMPRLVAHVSRQLRVRVSRLKQEGASVERALDANDRAALEWLRSLLVQPDEPPDSVVRDAPVLETSDGNLVSANELIDVIRREGRVPISRVPRTRDEIGAYADRGIPVLLLYRDLEDFLERQAIATVEVDGLEDGIEIAEGEWGKGEAALADRPPVVAQKRPWVPILAGAAVAAGLAFWALSPPAPRPAPMVPVVQHVIAEDPYAEPEAPSVRAGTVAPPAQKSRVLVSLAVIVAVLSGASGLGLIFFTLTERKAKMASWLRAEAGTPLTLGETRHRRWSVLSRAFLHPIDFFVARGWSARASGQKPLSAAAASIKGYREFAPEAPIRSGVRLDLDRVRIGFVDLMSASGDPHDGRILLRRDDRVLLNRNHPTVRDLISVAVVDRRRARLLLDVLLATDADLAKGTDPRQVEWDLLGRAENALRRS